MIIIASPPPWRGEMKWSPWERDGQIGRAVTRANEPTSHMMPMKPPLWASPLAGVPLSLRQKTNFQTVTKCTTYLEIDRH